MVEPHESDLGCVEREFLLSVVSVGFREHYLLWTNAQSTDFSGLMAAIIWQSTKLPSLLMPPKVGCFQL